MPTDPVPSAPAARYGRAQRRLLTAAAGLVVAALAAGAFALTYDTLRDLAVAGRVDDRWAPIYPATADALICVTLLSLVVTRGARWWTRLLRWALLLLLTAGLAALAVQDAVWGLDGLPADPVRAGVAAAPHVMLVLAVWLWLTMIKQIRVARPGAAPAETVETQRGHVKVLPALEASAEPDDAPALDFAGDDDAERPSGLDILPGMTTARPPAPAEAPALGPVRPHAHTPALEPAPDHTPHDRTWTNEPAPSREPDPARADTPHWTDEPARGPEPTQGHEPAQEDEPRREDERARRSEPARRDEPWWEDEPGRADEPASGHGAASAHEAAGAGEPEAREAEPSRDVREPARAGAAADEPAEDEPERGHRRTPGYEPTWADEPAVEREPEELPRPVPALLPTDVEVARAAGRPPRGARSQAPTTRPDIVVPDLDDHDSETPDAERAEDPDAGADPDDRWEPHPPPSTTFRSGPTPPAD